MTTVTTSEMAMLQNIRAKADELSHLLHDASLAGFNVILNLNGATGTVDVFNVFKMMPIDLKAGAN